MANEPQNNTENDGAAPGTGGAPTPPPGYDRIEEAGTYQMLWDCKYCGTKKLLGVTHKFCPSCGAAQDPTARYFPSDEEAIAVEDHEYTGADKKCNNCGTPNAAKAEFCTQCGAPMKDAKTVSLRSEQVTVEGAAFAGDSKAKAKEDFERQKLGLTGETAAAEGPPPSKKKWYIIGGVAGAAVVALIAGIFISRSVEVKVESHNWERVVKIEAFEPRSESSWCTSMPLGAYNVVRKREVSSTNQVADGETCDMVRVDKGDGTFKKERRCKTKYKSVPVYSDKCYYQVDRWQHKRDIVAKGGLNDQVAWPLVNIRTGNCRGCERESGRSESFNLVLAQVKKPDKKHNCSYPEAKWRAIPDGVVKKIKVRMIGGAKCDTLE
jgi:RNase P subunit RPR2